MRAVVVIVVVHRRKEGREEGRKADAMIAIADAEA